MFLDLYNYFSLVDKFILSKIRYLLPYNLTVKSYKSVRFCCKTLFETFWIGTTIFCRLSDSKIKTVVFKKEVVDPF